MTMIAGLPAPLAKALADKGYETLTPVQEAVLDPALAARDLLVSAQTGSGKTVAYGLAIAPELLGGVDLVEPAATPLALVVAPTRELALQVRREFEWLYGGAGVILASCVGGMDWRTERRALERGAHVVVGTPGRLRDHLERGTLSLAAARAVVLDEADEMLDLGFAEDLGFILAAAPEGRRTLMFSATVPKEIEKLARDYQKDAARVQVAGEARQHADIAYRALTVAQRDKEHAIFNLLRLHEAERAIVFAKTRANVNHLFARLVNRGFQAVALSGELSQGERSHALQALRDGRARVCVATDVAARGIDLPGLELVVHADLPTNPETLLHRSGRTGRAGAKGTSVLIVTPADFRKASRILQGAKVEAEWGKPPTAAEVQEAEDGRLLQHPLLAEAPGEEAAMAEALLAEHGAEQVAAAFVRLWRTGRSAPEVLSDEVDLPDRPAPPPRPREAFGPAVWYAMGVGHEGRAEARWLLPKICEAGGVSKDAIGAIRVQRDQTFVQIAEGQAGRFGAGLELEPGLAMTRLEGEPSLDRPAPREGYKPRPQGDRPRAPYQPKPPRIVEEEGEAPAEDRPARKPRWKAGERPAPAEGYRPRPPREEGEYRPRPPREAAEGYRPRPEGERKPRSAGTKSHGPEGKPRSEGYKSHSGDGRARAEGYKPRPPGEGKPYRPRPEGDAPRPRAEGYKPRSEGWKPRAEGYSPRPKAEGYKPRPEGDAPRPRAEGFKPRAEGDKPRPAAKYGEGPRKFGKPAAGGSKPPFKGKPGAKPWAKPAKPPADPRDTSRRFVPPKGPKPRQG